MAEGLNNSLELAEQGHLSEPLETSESDVARTSQKKRILEKLRPNRKKHLRLTKNTSNSMISDLLSSEVIQIPLPQRVNPTCPEHEEGLWVNSPFNNDELSTFQPFLKQLRAASSLFSSDQYAAMFQYMSQIVGASSMLALPNEIVKVTLWRLGIKLLSKAVIKSDEEHQLTYKLAVVPCAQWDLKGRQNLMGIMAKEDIHCLQAQTGHEVAELTLKEEEVKEKVLIIEVWASKKAGLGTLRRFSGSGKLKNPSRSNSAGSMTGQRQSVPKFIGRASCRLQDIECGRINKELILYSHSTNHEKGKIALQLAFKGLQPDSANDVIHAQQLLTQAVMKHESRTGANVFLRNWSAETSPEAKYLLSTHAAWNDIDELKKIEIELRALLDYHRCYKIKMGAFRSLLHQIETKTTAQEKKAQSDISNVAMSASSVSSGNDPLSLVSIDGGSIHICSASSAPLPIEVQSNADIAISEILKMLLELNDYIVNLLGQHLLFFDVSKGEELREHLQTLQKLYKLDSFLHYLPSDKQSFSNVLEDCVKTGVKSWLVLSDAEAEPKSGGPNASVKKLMFLAKTCSEMCDTIQKHLQVLFKEFGVNQYFMFFIKLIKDKLSEVTKDCINKKNPLHVDREAVILYFEAYLSCRQIDQCITSVGEPCLSEEQRLWTHYESLVPRWLETVYSKCEEMIEKAVELDKIVKVTDEVMYSSSAVDVEGILYQMFSFWKRLDWPDSQQAFGYAVKNFENICHCEEIYMKAMAEKVMFSDHQDFSFTEWTCTALNNMTHLKEQIVSKFEMESLQLQDQNDQENCVARVAELKTNIKETIENRILRAIEKLCDKLKPEITKRLVDEASIESLKDYLADNLYTCNANLFEDVFHKVLCSVWNTALTSISELLTSTQRNSQLLHKSLISLTEFFSPAFKDTEMETSLYKRVRAELELKALPTCSLVEKCCSELFSQQEIAEKRCGELFFSIAHVKDRLLEVNIIQAKVNEPYKDGSCEIFVYVWLLPLLLFSESFMGKKYKTQLEKGKLDPVFHKELVLPVDKKSLSAEGAIMLFGVYYTSSKNLAGMCILPCKQVPVLTEQDLTNGAVRSKFVLPLFTIRELKSHAMGELAIRHAALDTDAMKLYKYLTKKLHLTVASEQQ